MANKGRIQSDVSSQNLSVKDAYNAVKSAASSVVNKVVSVVKPSTVPAPTPAPMSKPSAPMSIAPPKVDYSKMMSTPQKAGTTAALSVVPTSKDKSSGSLQSFGAGSMFQQQIIAQQKVGTPSIIKPVVPQSLGPPKVDYSKMMSVAPQTTGAQGTLVSSQSKPQNLEPPRVDFNSFAGKELPFTKSWAPTVQTPSSLASPFTQSWIPSRSPEISINRTNPNITLTGDQLRTSGVIPPVQNKITVESMTAVETPRKSFAYIAPNPTGPTEITLNRNNNIVYSTPGADTNVSHDNTWNYLATRYANEVGGDPVGLNATKLSQALNANINKSNQGPKYTQSAPGDSWDTHKGATPRPEGWDTMSETDRFASKDVANLLARQEFARANPKPTAEQVASVLTPISYSDFTARGGIAPRGVYRIPPSSSTTSESFIGPQEPTSNIFPSASTPFLGFNNQYTNPRPTSGEAMPVYSPGTIGTKSKGGEWTYTENKQWEKTPSAISNFFKGWGERSQILPLAYAVSSGTISTPITKVGDKYMQGNVEIPASQLPRGFKAAEVTPKSSWTAASTPIFGITPFAGFKPMTWGSSSTTPIKIETPEEKASRVEKAKNMEMLGYEKAITDLGGNIEKGADAVVGWVPVVGHAPGAITHFLVDFSVGGLGKASQVVRKTAVGGLGATTTAEKFGAVVDIASVIPGVAALKGAKGVYLGVKGASALAKMGKAAKAVEEAELLYKEGKIGLKAIKEFRTADKAASTVVKTLEQQALKKAAESTNIVTKTLQKADSAVNKIIDLGRPTTSKTLTIGFQKGKQIAQFSSKATTLKKPLLTLTTGAYKPLSQTLVGGAAKIALYGGVASAASAKVANAALLSDMTPKEKEIFRQGFQEQQKGQGFWSGMRSEVSGAFGATDKEKAAMVEYYKSQGLSDAKIADWMNRAEILGKTEFATNVLSTATATEAIAQRGVMKEFGLLSGKVLPSGKSVAWQAVKSTWKPLAVFGGTESGIMQANQEMTRYGTPISKFGEQGRSEITLMNNLLYSTGIKKTESPENAKVGFSFKDQQGETWTKTASGTWESPTSKKEGKFANDKDIAEAYNYKQMATTSSAWGRIGIATLVGGATSAVAGGLIIGGSLMKNPVGRMIGKGTEVLSNIADPSEWHADVTAKWSGGIMRKAAGVKQIVPATQEFGKVGKRFTRFGSMDAAPPNLNRPIGQRLTSAAKDIKVGASKVVKEVGLATKKAGKGVQKAWRTAEDLPDFFGRTGRQVQKFGSELKGKKLTASFSPSFTLSGGRKTLTPTSSFSLTVGTPTPSQTKTQTQTNTKTLTPSQTWTNTWTNSQTQTPSQTPSQTNTVTTTETTTPSLQQVVPLFPLGGLGTRFDQGPGGTGLEGWGRRPLAFQKSLKARILGTKGPSTAGQEFYTGQEERN